jgi:hypothetical protein
MIEGALDVLSAAVLMQLAEIDLPPSVRVHAYTHSLNH